MVIKSKPAHKVRRRKKKSESPVAGKFELGMAPFCTDGVLIANLRSRRVKYANPAIGQLLDYEKSEFSGMPMGNLHPEGIFDPMVLKLKGLPEGAHLSEEKVSCVTKAGVVKSFDVYASVQVVEGKRCIVALYRPIPPPKPNPLKGKKLKDELEKQVAERTQAFATDIENLKELNAALKMMLERRDKDRTVFEEKVVLNVKQLVTPYLKRLKQTGLDIRQQAFVAILEDNLADIISPFTHTLSAEYISFTASEIRIANLIRQGKKNREIAELFGISKRTVEAHRDHIRTKLKLKKQKINLRTHLMAIR